MKLPLGSYPLDFTEYPWRDDRCILCKLPKQLTLEHIFRQCLGGILECRFLCGECNSALGVGYEGGLLDSPEIRFAVERTPDLKPALYRRMVEGRGFVLDGAGGQVSARMKGGRIAPLRTTVFRDGEEVTTLQSRTDAKRTIQDELKARGLAAVEIEDTIKRLSSAPMDQRVEVAPGLEFANWSVAECSPTPDGFLIDQRFVLKIAFEFLALCPCAPVFDAKSSDLRDCLRNEKELPVWTPITELRSKQGYRPFHSILLDQSGNHTQVVVTLFGWLVWRVEFLPVRTPELPNIGYLLDITSTTRFFDVFESPKPAA